MRILLVNDDGYSAKGIYHLAKAASKLGEVWIVAPREQCSAMSHRIHFRKKFLIRKEQVLEGIPAYSVDGTPADCVKIAVNHIMPERPDIVFSGINDGYNTGIDILFSGTVAAAMEALLQGIPAIAFSMGRKGDFADAEQLIAPVFEQLRERSIRSNEIFNVNFPPCSPSEIRGILFDRPAANQKPYDDSHYSATPVEDGVWEAEQQMEWINTQEEGSDLATVRGNYISVSKIRNMILRGE
ncbi:MAG: 5'/3'-nucleotidase SurE [Oscillospiraceae bacterium]|nr:5'/3'-nucleotidase SurE [Oscillospiraceae bacterium]